MQENVDVIRRFYEAFRKLDAESMAACYHAEATFADPVFPNLRGRQIGDMWRMLLAGARSLDVSLHHVEALDESRAEAKWEARYSFGRAGRRVHNRIHARFVLKDGLILRHDDQFDLWRWSRMALGAPGALLGWSPLMQNRIRRDAARRLDAYRAKKN